jgi:prepilin-type N-terminal cleavage/methylation domain-containing protein/prepilin-type processing-associated H-X9-DG protein
MKRVAAFTLIELLVVIAIIAILAAILFPVFAQAKRAAKTAASITYKKQIGIGALMYAADYDDRMFLFLIREGNHARFWFTGVENWYASGVRRNRPEWALLHPYMRNQRIMDCPNAADIPMPTSFENPFWPAYGINDVYLLGGSILNPVPVAFTQAEDPAQTVLLTDVATTSLLTGQLIRLNTVRPPSRSALPNVHFRHSGKTTVLWLDGHVDKRSATYKSDDYRPSSTSIVTGRLLRERGVGNLANRPLPDVIPAGDPMIPAYDFYFTLEKVQ